MPGSDPIRLTEKIERNVGGKGADPFDAMDLNVDGRKVYAATGGRAFDRALPAVARLEAAVEALACLEVWQTGDEGLLAGLAGLTRVASRLVRPSAQRRAT